MQTRVIALIGDGNTPKSVKPEGGDSRKTDLSGKEAMKNRMGRYHGNKFSSRD
jgi:hypothetical protein